MLPANVDGAIAAIAADLGFSYDLGNAVFLISRLPGLIACVALIFYTLVNYALFRTIPVTLTLAGIAGFVLSVGMAVDANILIFERTKEELRAGKSLTGAAIIGLLEPPGRIASGQIKLQGERISPG